MSIVQRSDACLSMRPRIGLFSQRNRLHTVSRSVTYEFEELISEIDAVEVLAPQRAQGSTVPSLCRAFARRWPHNRFVHRISTLEQCRLPRRYDVFFLLCQQVPDLRGLQAVARWKEQCGISVCWLEEVWANELHKYPDCLKLLSQFDYVIVNCSNSVQAIQDATDCVCYYLPTAIDTIRFCPFPHSPRRSVDVFSLGRRSEVIHKSLLALAEQRNMFYIYDTLDSMTVVDHGGHRNLIANFAKRSRYFLVNPPKFDVIHQTNGQSEIGYRYFEGIASGTVMLGETPNNERFNEHFDWPDVVYPVPRDTENIGDILDTLDAQPERLEDIRRHNVINALLRHDWAYRWKALLDILGLDSMPAYEARVHRIQELAEMANKAIY